MQTGDEAAAVPLVLLPGFMADLRLWAPQIEALAPRVSLLLPHWAGWTDVGAAAEAVLAMAPPRFALAGLSLGGAVAMEMLRLAPERVTRMALGGISALSEPPAIASVRRARVAEARTGGLEEAMLAELPERCLAAGPMRGAVRAFAVEMALGLGMEAYACQSQAMQTRPDQQKTLRTTRCPVLVLGGAEDRLVLPRRHDFAAGLIPQARLEVIEGAGHLPTLEQPERVTALLTEWLAPQRAAAATSAMPARAP